MSSDRPGWPHVKCKEDEYVPLSLGWVGKGFVLATLAAIGTVSVTAYRLEAGEDADETLEESIQSVEDNVETLDQNIHKIDEQVRLNAQKAEFANRQNRALLEAAGVTKRIEPPPVKPSELEELE